jgi:hypothetical protein
MKKTTTILFIALIAISCKNESFGNNQDSPQKVACSESEAFSFAKKSLENSLAMEITGNKNLSSSNETCEYKFLFEGISYRYNDGVDVEITVKKNENGWEIISSNIEKM